MAGDAQEEGAPGSESGDDLDAVLETTAILFTIGGAAVSIAAPPLALGLGAGAGALQLVTLVRQRWSRRAAEVATGAEERLGPDAVNAAHRIMTNEELAALSYQAVEASLRAHYEEHARTLGRVLGDALRSEEPLSVDEASILLEALRSLDLPHLTALRRLSELAESNPERNWVQDVLDMLAVPDEAIAFGIGSALQRAGAMQLDPPGFGGYYLTPLGQRLLDYVGNA